MGGATFELSATDLSAGDVLVLYTDGIVEAMNDAEEMLGDDRLKAALQYSAAAGRRMNDPFAVICTTSSIEHPVRSG